jgi:hypothetical protein
MNHDLIHRVPASGKFLPDPRLNSQIILFTISNINKIVRLVTPHC